VSCRGPPATGLLTGFVFGSAPFDLGHAPGLDTGAGSGFRASCEAISGDIGSAGGGTGLFPSTPSLDQNEH